MKAITTEKTILLMLGIIIFIPLLFFSINALIFSDIFREKGQEFRRGKGVPVVGEDEIMNAANRYGTSIGTRDYRNMDGSEGYEYLTSALKKEFLKNNEPQKVLKYYKNSQLVTTKESIRYTYFVIDGDHAEIRFTLKIGLKEATDNYLSATKLTQGSVYDRHITLLMAKENGEWKIDKIN